MQKITPFLWFNDNAEEAVNYYTSTFKDSKVTNITRYENAGPELDQKVIVTTFELYGQEFMALNGGPEYSFTSVISLFVHCETQTEVDELWDKLADGGQLQQCGWVTDRFGVTWQIIPNALGEMLQDKDGEKSHRVMEAMLKMVKIDVDTLKRAYDGQ